MSLPMILIIFTLMTPGPLDHNGGHVDKEDGRYHLHAGSSYQFRYVDLSGRIWTGNGPRPEEYLLHRGSPHPLAFVNWEWFSYVIVGAILCIVFIIGRELRTRMGYGQHRHRHHGVEGRREWFAAMKSSWPRFDRRRHERRVAALFPRPAQEIR